MIAAVGIGMLAGTSQQATAQGLIVDKQSEYNVKTAFIYNFGRYTTWPASSMSRQTFVIGILGDSPLRSRLQKVAESRKITDRRSRRELSIEVTSLDSDDNFEHCHILVIHSKVDAKTQASVIQKLRNRPILLIGDANNFATSGGTIQFFITDGRVKFKLNLEVARQKSLAVDAKLMEIAEIVKTEKIQTPLTEPGNNFVDLSTNKQEE